MDRAVTATDRAAQISTRKLVMCWPLRSSNQNTATPRSETSRATRWRVSAETVSEVPADAGFVCDTATLLDMAIQETLCIMVRYTV
jgi:hypothetical protein